VRNSVLALKGWTRTNGHQNRPFVAPGSMYERVDEAVRADLRTALGGSRRPPGGTACR
jgi:hypothetical protein